MNIKINNRLLKISDFIYKEDKVIDIGCDHGLLGIYLVLNKKVNKMISSDINEMPLQKAKENIKKYNLEDKIETRLGNGLACVDENIDTIIISGMGGLTIIDILKDIKNYDYIKKIIISPNTDFEETRKELSKLGFNLEEEIMILENKKYYLVSCYIRKKKCKVNYFFGKLNLSNKIVKDYYLSIVRKNKIIMKNLSFKYILKKINLFLINLRILKKIK